VCLGARDRNLRVEVSFYEVYAGKCFDLLAERKRVNALEDALGRVRVVGLTERVVREPHEVLALAEEGAACRKTSRTDANASSSRSHSVFQIALKAPHAAYETASESLDESQSARLSLVDLAGSERGADRGKAVSESVRREGAEINTSLLALKECIRALSVEKIAYAAEPAGCTPNDAEKARVPFRGSKLTTVLRDAFVGKRSRTVLLAHISPGHDAAEHTVNTLRYATRLKEMGGDGPREKGEKRAFPEKIPPLRERDANATEKSDVGVLPSPDARRARGEAPRRVRERQDAPGRAQDARARVRGGGGGSGVRGTRARRGRARRRGGGRGTTRTRAPRAAPRATNSTPRATRSRRRSSGARRSSRARDERQRTRARHARRSRRRWMLLMYDDESLRRESLFDRFYLH
jgi:kinesin family protein 2/24